MSSEKEPPKEESPKTEGSSGMEQLSQLLQLVQAGQQEISQEVKDSRNQGKVAQYATPASGVILAVVVGFAWNAQTKQIDKLAESVATLSKSVSSLEVADNNFAIKIREAITNAPYPWLKDKPEYDRRLRDAERKIDRLELTIESLRSTIESLKKGAAPPVSSGRSPPKGVGAFPGVPAFIVGEMWSWLMPKFAI